jgi:hypothetical protein
LYQSTYSGDFFKMKHLAYITLLATSLSLSSARAQSEPIVPFMPATALEDSQATSIANQARPSSTQINFDLLPFLADERKKLEAALIKRDAEIIRLMNELTRVRIEHKECEIEYKTCRRETTLQLIFGGLATVTSAYAGYKCQ